MFNTMLWWAGASLTGEKLYFESSVAKKKVAGVFGLYAASIFGVFFQNMKQGAPFVSNFMNVRGALYITVVPLGLSFWAYKTL